MLKREQQSVAACRLGVSLDEARNRSANNPINDTRSRSAVYVLPSQEDEQIARQPGHYSHVETAAELLPRC